MRATDHVFELVKTLSKSEKGYFKKINSFHGKGEQNSYMILFNAIDKMETYDQKLLKKQLGDRIHTSLAGLKHYLYYQLLDSLDQYYKSSSAEINKWICKMEILYKKGLVDHAQKMIEKAIGYAEKKEKFPYLLQLLRLRYEYLTEEENKERMMIQRSILDADLKIIRKKIDNLYPFLNLRIRLNVLRAEIGYARNEEQVQKYKMLLNHASLKEERLLLSNSARYYFHSIRARVFDYMHEYETAYASCKKVMALFEEFPVLFEEDISAKIQALQRKCTLACILRMFDEARADIVRLRELKTSHEKYLAQIFQYSFHQEFQIYLWTGEFKTLIKRIPDFEKQYKCYGGKISKTSGLRMFRQINEALFIEGYFEEALDWISKAINNIPSSFRDDVVSGIKIHEIFTHFELGNYRLVKSRITATEKYLKTKNKPFVIEHYLLSTLERLINAQTEENKFQVLKKAQPYVEKLFNDPEENIPLKYFYLRAWLESKIQKIPMPDVLKKHLHEYHFPRQQKDV